MLGTKLFILLYLVIVAGAEYQETLLRPTRRIPIQRPLRSNVIEINAVPLSLATLSKTMSEQAFREPQSIPELEAQSVPELKFPIFRLRSPFPESKLEPGNEPQSETDPDTELKSDHESDESTPEPEPHNPSTTLKPIDILCEVKNAYYAIPSKCDTFVECRKYVGKKRVCPDGLLFNPKAKWPRYPCSYPSEVECGNYTIMTQVFEPTGECPRRFGTFSWNNGDCGKYIVCDDGRPVLMNCPTGLSFNPKINACDWPDNVPNCNPEVFHDFVCPVADDLIGNLSEKDYNYRYKNSCKEYIACIKGKPRLLQCDTGLSFDEVSARCIDSDAVVNCKKHTKIVDTKLYIRRL